MYKMLGALSHNSFQKRLITHFCYVSISHGHNWLKKAISAFCIYFDFHSSSTQSGQIIRFYLAVKHKYLLPCPWLTQHLEHE